MDFISPKGLRLILKTLSTIKTIQEGGGNQAEQNRINTGKPINTFTNIPVKTNFQNEMKAQMLNRTEQSLLMKELLNIPKDLKQLLALFANKNTSSQAFSRLLQSTSFKINTEIIQQLLETNSREVINRLIRLIQQAPGNTQNYDQLKPLLALLAQVTPARDSSPQEVLAHLLLLYLPWLPLMEEQRIMVRFEKKKSGGSDEDQVAMVIYISTINLGRFKVSILIDKDKKLDIHIEHISETDEKESDEEIKARKEILDNILKSFDAEVKEEKIKANAYVSEVKQKNFTESEERNVTISKVNSISPAILLAAQKIARIILEIDEKICLQEKRKRNLDTEQK